MTNIKDKFISYISNDKNIRRIPTGMAKIDEAFEGGLPTGLIILGAITGIGKTTFVLQLADNMAKQPNTKVLFFSLELRDIELMAKSLSRISYLNEDLTSHTPNEFIGRKVENIEDYFNKYDEIIDNIFLVDTESNITSIVNNSKAFCRKYADDNIIIVIDYLQFINPDNNGNDKQNIDYIIRELKKLSRDYGVSIIAISSINRTSYKNNTIGSFKESGSIEYTADYLLALNQKEEKETLSFGSNDNIITLSFLKNRYGLKPDIDYKYYGQYATFIEK